MTCHSLKRSLFSYHMKVNVKRRPTFTKSMASEEKEQDKEGVNPPKIEFLKTEDESECKVKCPFCDKYFVPTSILKHLSQSKKCKPFSSPDLQAYLKGNQPQIPSPTFATYINRYSTH